VKVQTGIRGTVLLSLARDDMEVGGQRHAQATVHIVQQALYTKHYNLKVFCSLWSTWAGRNPALRSII